MYRYTIKMDGSDYTSEEILHDEYEVGERMLLGDEGGKVIRDEDGNEVETVFPRPVYGTIITKEKITEL